MITSTSHNIVSSLRKETRPRGGVVCGARALGNPARASEKVTIQYGVTACRRSFAGRAAGPPFPRVLHSAVRAYRISGPVGSRCKNTTSDDGDVSLALPAAPASRTATELEYIL
ncbi:hypothetical protein EVAR_37348_1 [Eumeta japonica]|uniref:Uncharacterized protein n=1 Tax=Eumeta variegata TaxID=151549 RepID=A0A4C1WZC4_EUMVA|nr:hypothetical protein EVAR_37348_1 [Eumeta japonica]